MKGELEKEIKEVMEKGGKEGKKERIKEDRNRK